MRHSWNDLHMLSAAKALLCALYATLGIFVGLFVLFHIGTALYLSYLLQNQLDAFHAGIATDTAHLVAEGDAAARNGTLQTQLLANDREGLLATLQQERSERDIGLMGVANKEGVILGRTLTTGKYGDNVFLSTPAGRVVRQGKSVQSIELTGFGNQIFLTTARPILAQDEMIGALFANYLLDDTYASHVTKSYLSPGAAVVFYTKEYGVYGNSFTDKETRALVTSYFNSGSEWVQNGISEKIVVFDDGRSYLVANIVFPGLEQSPGGALLFIPAKNTSGLSNGITAALTLLVFLFFALRTHLRTSADERGWRYYVLLGLFSLPILVLAYFGLSAQNFGRLELQHIPYPLYNSTARLQPEWGIFTVGLEQRFSVIVDTGDEEINAVQVEIQFDPQAVDVQSLDLTNSACTYVIERLIDIKAGTIHLSCVIMGAQKNQHAFTIAEVLLVPKQKGIFTLRFNDDETHVLANDGLGTDVLRSSQDGSYRVDNFSVLAEDTSVATTTARTFVVFSPTHPNTIRWYKAKQATFVWQGKADDVYQYAFDSSPDTIPSKKNTLQEASISLPIPGDGVFYFHLRLASGGPTAHYRIQSDTTPPTIVGLRASSEKVFTGDVVRFSLEAEDAGSGVQRNYYIDTGNHLFLPTGSKLYVPFLEAGEQKLIFRVYDDAGNYTEQTKYITVRESP